MAKVIKRAPRIPNARSCAVMSEMRDSGNLYGRITSRERFVIDRRFGLAGEPPLTLEEIGKGLKVSRERIRQITKNTLDKLGVDPWA